MKSSLLKYIFVVEVCLPVHADFRVLEIIIRIMIIKVNHKEVFPYQRWQPQQYHVTLYLILPPGWGSIVSFHILIVSGPLKPLFMIKPN